MKSIPAFSKKSTGGGIATGGKTRSGFLDNVKTTNLAKGKSSAAHGGNLPGQKHALADQRKVQGTGLQERLRQSR